MVNLMSEHHSLSTWLSNSLFRKYDLTKFGSTMKQKKAYSPFLIYEDDTQLSLLLWGTLDCVFEVDCVQRLAPKGYA